MRNKITVAMSIVIVIVAVVAVMTTACTSASQHDAPEPEPDDIINGTHTQVIQMPDGFRNLAFTCHGTVGLYVTSRGWVQSSADKNIVPLPSTVSAVTDHPMCKK